MTAIGGATVLTVVGLVAALLAAGRDGRPAESRAASQTADARRFYADVRTSLAPLLAHVAALPAALQRAESELAPDGLTAAAQAWAHEMDTARDLVGRLIPPPGPEGVPARSIYELGAMVYSESARSLARLPGLVEGGQRADAARSGLRLQLLADRLFDQAKRLLDLHGDLGAQPVMLLPAEVPDFDKEGLGPGGASARVPEGSGFAGRSPPLIPSIGWRDSHLGQLAGAVATLGGIIDYRLAVAGPHDELRKGSAALHAASRELAGPLPREPAARQGSFLLRLSLLVEAESLAVASTAASPADPAVGQAERLRLIGDRLWQLGRDLFAADGAPLPASLNLPEPAIDPTIVRRGGMFDGHPPPLRPGDPPDTGVPGGLRVPAPSEVFTG
jgi:hypothetical protein